MIGSTIGGYTMEDRLKELQDLEEQMFERAVTRAAAEVSQTLAALHRRRLVTQTAIAVAGVIALVAVIIIFVVRDEAKTSAQANCNLITSVSQILGSGSKSTLFQGKRQGFLSSDALLRKQQALDAKKINALHSGPLKALFLDPETKRLTKVSDQLNTDVTSFWDHTLVSELDKVAQANCKGQF